MFRKKPKTQPRRSTAEYQSANVFSYYASRSRTETPVGRHDEQPGRTNTSWWKHLPSLISLIAMAICAGYILSLSTNPKVRLYTGVGNDVLLRDLGVYQRVAQDIMSSSLLNSTKLTINTEGLADKLQSQFPELTDVSVTIPLSGRRPIFEILPSKTALILIAKNGAFVVNEQGVAIMRLSELPKSSNLSIPSTTDESGLSVEVGKAALPATTASFITEVVTQLKTNNVSISGMSLPLIANELHVRISGQPYYIKFNLQGRARDQSGTYLAIKKRLETDKVTPAEYIDVRVEERAYYK